MSNTTYLCPKRKQTGKTRLFVPQFQRLFLFCPKSGRHMSVPRGHCITTMPSTEDSEGGVINVFLASSASPDTMLEGEELKYQEEQKKIQNLRRSRREVKGRARSAKERLDPYNWEGSSPGISPCGQLNITSCLLLLLPLSFFLLLLLLLLSLSLTS